MKQVIIMFSTILFSIVGFSQNIEGVWLSNSGAVPEDNVGRLVFISNSAGCYTGSFQVLEPQADMMVASVNRPFMVDCSKVKDGLYRLIMLDNSGDELTLETYREDRFDYFRVKGDAGFAKSKYGYFVEYMYLGPNE